MFSIFQRRVGWRNFMKDSPVTALILLVNTTLFIITIFYGATTGYGLSIQFHPQLLWELGAIDGSIIDDASQMWRIVTAAFLHGDLMHYLSNMIIGVFTLSAALERLIGSKKFSFIYFGSLFISGIIVAVFSEPNVVTIGASGAIFGVLGSLLYITLYRRNMMSARDAQSIRALIVMNVIFTFLASGISIPGHIGGIIGGFALSFLLIQPIKNEPDTIEKSTYQDLFNRYDPFDQYDDDNKDDGYH